MPGAKSAVAQDEGAAILRDPRFNLVERALKRFQYQGSALIEVLHTAQEAFGYLPEELLRVVAEKLNLPESQVMGVATFYHFFTLKPKGEHNCIVCTGTACYVKGAGEIVSAVEERYGIHAGETTADGRLSLGTARCLGNCSIAPMLTIDNEVYGRQTPESTLERIDVRLQGQGDES